MKREAHEANSSVASPSCEEVLAPKAQPQSLSVASDCDAHSELEIYLPDNAHLTHVGEFFKVLGDTTRIRILMLLRAQELCVHTIVRHIGAEQSAVSHHLKLLRDAGVVACRREGKHIFYSLADDHIKNILDTTVTHLQHTK